jgi:alkylated DNA repair dioxygenase AlkB
MTTPAYSAFTEHVLAPGSSVYSGELPCDRGFDDAAFAELWDMHPADLPDVQFGDTRLKAPRWHQAYGRDYEFAGFVSRASPIPAILAPVVEWVRDAIDPRVNGVLVNWYDGDFEHRIAPHKDSPIGRVAGCPIVTVSLGAPRTFQLFVRRKRVLLPTGNGTVIVIPDETNKRFAHAVPHLPGDRGRRISITLRGFSDDPSHFPR